MINTRSEIPPKRTFFENLNGLRFMGALMVFVFHCFTLNREIWGDFQNNTNFQYVYKLMSKGHHGVGLFFVLSGFLITYLLLDEVKRKGIISVGHFFMRRVLRIWPLYFLIVLFGFVIFPLLPFGQSTVHSPFFYSIFLSNLDEIWVGLNDNLNFLTITWSVSIEEQFYLSWMFLMLLFPFFRKGKYYPVYFLVLIFATVLFRMYHYADERTLYFHTFAVVSDLALGGLLAYAVGKNVLQQSLARINKFWIGIIYILGISLIVFSNQIFIGAFVALERLFIGSFFAFIILEQVFSDHSFYKADKIPGFFFSGELTYGFYMFHCIFIYYWSICFEMNHLTGSLWQFVLYVVLVFVSTYVTAYLSMQFFEQPILRWKKYFR